MTGCIDNKNGVFFMVDRARCFTRLRLREPSTWVGAAGVLGGLGYSIAPELIGPISQICAGLAGVAVFMAEKGGE